MRANAAFSGQLHDGRHVFPPETGKAASELPGAHPHHREALDQRDIGTDVRNTATGEPDHQQAATERDAAGRFVERIAPDRIIDEVGAASAGDFEHGLAKADRAGEHMLRRIEVRNAAALFLAGGDGDHPQP